MRFKDLFTVPTGQKVTEKDLRRVLISSICSILLCMTCLVSATWAWFAVSIENTENVIQIGTPEVKLTVNGNDFESGNKLRSRENIILIEHANELDDLQKKSALYVTFSVNNVVQGCVMLDSSNGYKMSITIETDKEHPLSWTVSWFKPDTDPLAENAINLINEETGSTDGAAESTETTAPTETTNPTETVTEPSTETATESTTEQTTDPTTATPSETNPTESSQTETTSTTNPSVETAASTESTTESTGEADDVV